MLLNYTPPGADKQVFPYDPEKLMSSEAEAIEKVTHLTYSEFGLELIKGSVTARRALLWVLLKRKDPQLRHAQVDFPAGAVELEYEQHELKKIREGVENDADMSDADRVIALKELDQLILDQMASAEEAAPKAPSSDVASSD
jgi:hypothetical protein